MPPQKLHLAIALGATDREPPTEFRVFSAGVVRTTKGTFLFDDKSIAAVMAFYAEHGADVPIDYDHLMIDAFAPMGGGKAAGWLTLEVRGGELWATGVKWTPAGAEALRNAEYRYISPAFEIDEESRITRLINVALTNLPATHGLDPLVAANQKAAASAEKETRTMKAILIALGLAENATEADVVVAIGRLKDAAAQNDVKLAQVIKVTGAKDADEAVGKVAGLRDEAAKVIALNARVVELESGLRRKEVEEKVSEKVLAGFLAPANREFAITLGMESPKSFDAYLATLTSQVINLDGGKDKPAAGQSNVVLTSEQRAIAKNLGFSDEEYVAILAPKGAA